MDRIYIYEIVISNFLYTPEKVCLATNEMVSKAPEQNKPQIYNINAYRIVLCTIINCSIINKYK